MNRFHKDEEIRMQEKYAAIQQGLRDNFYLNSWIRLIGLAILYGCLTLFAINTYIQQASAVAWQQPSFLFETALNGYQPDVPPGPYLTTGSVVTWTYTITNTGNVPFDNVTLAIDLQGNQMDNTDGSIAPVLSGDENGNFLLDVDEAWIFTADLTIGHGAYIATSAISADPIDHLGNPIVGPDKQPLPTMIISESLYYMGTRPAIELIIQPDDPAFLADEPIEWTYIVVNSGTTPLTNILLVDDIHKPIHTQLTRDENGDESSDENGNGLLDMGERWVYKSSSLASPGQQTHTAQISAQPADASGTPLTRFDGVAFAPITSTTTSNYLGVRPALTLEYYAGDIGGDEIYMAATSENIRYTFLIENSGDVALTNLQIQDDNGTVDTNADDFILNSAQCPALAGPLLPGQSTLCHLQKDIPNGGDIHNSRATVTGAPTNADIPLTNVPWPTAWDEAKVALIMPALRLEHTLYPGHSNGIDCPGQEQLFFVGSAAITHCYRVINSGNVYLDKVRLFDDRGDFLFDHDQPLGPAQSVEFFIEQTVDASRADTTTAAGQPSEANGLPYSGLAPVIVTDTVHLYQEEVSVGGIVWYDDDGDGLLEEAGVADITVYLLDGLTGDAVLGQDGNPLQRVTAQDGRYLFENLHPREYMVKFDLTSLPADYKPTVSHSDDPTSQSKVDAATGRTSTTGILFGGEEDQMLHLGIIKGVQVGGLVWVDENQDGQQDDGELGLAGIQMTLLDVDTGQSMLTAITDPQGRYLFESLPAGSYAVRLDVMPPNYRPLSVDLAQITADPLSGSQHDLTLDFALMETIQLGGRVWYDNNDDGIQGDHQVEQGVWGVAVTLLHNDTGQPLQDEDGVPIVRYTDIEGRYAFENLSPEIFLLGSYRVQFDLATLPHNYIPTIRYADSDTADSDTVDSDADPITGGTAAIEIIQSKSKSFDLGIVYSPPNDSSDSEPDEPPSPLTTLGDTVWFDLDRDGILDEDESGIEGITMHLYNEAGFLIRTTRTGAGGFYLFKDIMAGTYRLQCVQKLGYLISPQNMGSDPTLDSDVDPDSCQTPLISVMPTAMSPMTSTVTFTVTSPVYDGSWDVGLYTLDRSGVISNHIWFDSNQNGRSDPHESGVSGVLVDLYNINNELLWTERTDTTGSYRFYDLPYGAYYLEFSPAPEYVPNLQPRLDNSQKIRTPLISLNEMSNQATGSMLGLHLNGAAPASLGSQVWHDLNRDGIKNENESGLPDVLVKLYDINERISATAITDEKGHYLFQGLVPKIYRLEFTPPPGFSIVAMNPEDDTKEIDLFTLRTTEITLSNAADELSLEVGFARWPTALTVTSDSEFINLYLPVIYKP